MEIFSKPLSKNADSNDFATTIEGWAVLPTDVKRIIFNFADEDLAGIYRSRRVCKDWKNAIEGFTGFWEQQAEYDIAIRLITIGIW